MASKIKITFLGTADSIPTRNRNHVSILLNYNEENILIDCGEGTQRQLRKANLNPCKINKILITHWHGDHVLGLPGLLSTLALSGYGKKLEIYGPRGIKKKIQSMFELYKFHLEYPVVVKEISPGVFVNKEEFLLSCEKMEHGVSCLGYSFFAKGHKRIKSKKVKELGSGPHLKKLKEGKDLVIGGKKIKSKDCIYQEEDRKISFILDTKFNERIIPFVKDSDLLISEATYSKEMKKEAEEHLHLTISDAAKIAKKAKVKKLFLIHISSRYLGDMKSFLKDAKEIFKETYLPRDLDFLELN
jgi:ribonuclease Z